MMEVAMPLDFPNPLPHVDPDTIRLVFFGRDRATQAEIEIRITAKALQDCFGAEGATDAVLITAFNSQHQAIKAAAEKKFDPQRTERQPDRFILYLDSDDF